MRSSIIIIANPVSRTFSLSRIRQAEVFLQQQGFGTELVLTHYKDHAQLLAREALEKNPYCIIAAGGDGTINEVINGMYGSDIPLGILPLGTTNVLARELSLPLDAAGAIKRVLSGTPQYISLGRISLSAGDRFFCLMAGIGFDAKAVFDVSRRLKRYSGEAAYIISGIRNLIRYSPEKLIITADGTTHDAYTAIIGKASRYGGDFRVTPDADIREASLHLCMLAGARRTDLLRFAFGIVTGDHLKDPDVVHLKAYEIAISGHAHIQIDGDYIGETPARFSVERNALKILF